MNKDQVTTLLGVIGAGITAATPVLNGVTNASLHSGDWTQLGTALMFGLLGYFTNKKDK